jgi:hypothetical protein
MDAYSKAVTLCLDKIREVNEIHKDQSEESRAFETRKVIMKWFRTGGKI